MYALCGAPSLILVKMCICGLQLLALRLGLKRWNSNRIEERRRLCYEGKKEK